MLPWRSKSSAGQLAAKAGTVKKTLLNTLNEAVSELQYEFRNTDQTIESTEVVGRLVTALEAVFVHGLKETFLGRLSSRLSSTSELGTNSPRMPEPSFWTFALVFSHRAVITQVENLVQISTEVGRARAWLRQAINDGLLVSYLTAMVADQVSLSVHYEKHAFLRDPDMRDVGLTYLTGIEVYNFRLSVNVSTLNRWQPGPLVLAGVWTGTVTLDTAAEDAVAVLEEDEAADTHPQVPGFARTLAEPILSPGGSQGGYLRRGLINEDEALRLILASTPVSFSPGMDAPLTSTKNDDLEACLSAVQNLSLDSPEPDRGESKSLASELLLPGAVQSGHSPSPEPMWCQQDTHSVSPTLEWDHASPQVRGGGDSDLLATSLADEMKEAEIANFINGRENYVEQSSLELEEKESEDAVVPDAGVEEASTVLDLERERSSNGSIGTPDSEASCRCSSTGPQPDCPVCCRHPAPTGRPFLLEADLADTSGPGEDLIAVQTQRARRLEQGLGFGDHPPHLRVASLSLTQNISLTSCLDLLSHEVGLDSQDWQCHDCSKAVGAIFGPGRVCELTKKYFCSDCHTDQDSSVIPARLLYNWDCAPYKVAKSSALFLRHVAVKPIINIGTFNPALAKFAPALDTAHNLRKQLTYLSAYLTACSRAGQEGVQVSLAESVWPREYLYTGTDLYSIRDLEQLHSGELLTTLSGAVRMCVKHVMSCLVCSGRGFLCELCSDKRPVYPFNLDSVAQCADCHTVFHAKCARGQVNCPRCERIEARSLNLLVTSTKLSREIQDLR